MYEGTEPHPTPRISIGLQYMVLVMICGTGKLPDIHFAEFSSFARAVVDMPANTHLISC